MCLRRIRKRLHTGYAGDAKHSLQSFLDLPKTQEIVSLVVQYHTSHVCVPSLKSAASTAARLTPCVVTFALWRGLDDALDRLCIDNQRLQLLP